ncbi:MAG: FecR family protein [Chitinophagaceae bacterium]
MKKRQFIRILRKYRAGNATKEESEFIESYYNLFETEPGVEAWLNEEKAAGIKEQTLNKIWEKVRRQEQTVAEPKVIRLYPGITKVAAAIILIIASGVAFYWIKESTQRKNSFVAENPEKENKNNILPGTNQAVLTLANGKQVTLSGVQNGAVSRQGNTQIIKLNNGLVSYQPQKSSKNQGAPIPVTPQYNTVSTPAGGQYQVILPDGSKVWLNAASSLRFPVAFTGDARVVEVSGEAYFEIAPNAKQPFIVKSGNTQVEVLGTHFNINAYPERKYIRTTLQQGSIRIIEGDESVVLKPGEQASTNQQTSEIKLKTVNVDEALAWKNGLFYFENTNIKEIMGEIARWYNVEVIYETKDLSNKNFNGIISRYSNVNAVLERFSLTGTVHFKIEGRTIMVMN